MMLASYYMDIVYEDPSGKRAEKSPKVDFIIPSIKTLVEVKYVDKKSGWKRIKEELDADITQYEQGWPDFYKVFTIYDAENVFPNKEIVKRDYKKSHPKVLIEFIP